VRGVGHVCQAVRELWQVGIPVADVAEPAGINVEHLEAKLLCVGHQAQGELFD